MNTWLGGLAVAVAASGCAIAEMDAPTDAAPAYLALGDSVAFGYDPHVPGQREVGGYPEVIAARRGLELTNASCPGEASGGFRSPDGLDNGCRENRRAYPLHVSYEGTQLAFAVDYLAAHPSTALVTIDLGANDAKKLQDGCLGEATCVLAGFLGVLGDYTTNLDFIFGELRKVYDGPLVALAIYNPFPTDTLSQYGVDRLNAVLASKVAEHGGVLADGHAAFQQAGGADPCTSGLLIPMGNGTCDIHPTPRGDEVLADVIETALARM